MIKTAANPIKTGHGPLSRRGSVLGVFLLFAVLLILLDVWKSYTGREGELSDARRNLENVVRLIAEQSQSTIELTDTLLLEEVTRLEAAPVDAFLRLRVNKALTAAVANSPRILVISIFDERGDWLINSSATAPDMSQNFADREYFQHHRVDPSRDLYIGVPVKRKTTGQWAFTLSRRWNKPDGSFGGVVIAAITLDYLQNFFKTIDMGRDGVLALHRADGVTLARHPYVESNVGKSVAKGDMFSKYLPQSPHGTYRITSVLDKGDRYASYRRLTRYPLVASAALNMDEVLTPWRQETALNLGTLAGVLLLAGLMAWRLEVQLARRALAERAVQQANMDLQQALQEREASQARLQESEFFMASLLDHVPGMVAYWTTELRCAFANQHYLEWFGRTKEQMRGITMQELLGQALFDKNEPMVRAALRGEPQQFERTLTKPSGEVGYTFAQYLPTREDGQVRGFLAVVSDVTALKQAQFRLEKLNQELEQRGEQLEAASKAKSQFLANMSHEIRTPMNGVLGMVQLLEKTALTPQQLDYVRKTQLAASTLLAILNDILDFSKIEAGKLELELAPFELDRLLRALAAILASSVGNKPVEVLFDIDPKVPDTLLGDGLRLQQVLLNLSGNAVKFTMQGEVVLAVRQLRREGNRCEVEFSVRDTGIGISAEQTMHIFEGFSQAEVSTTRRFGGSGLGLTISKRLVELMGGHLAVSSVLGQGSEFRFSVVFEMATTPSPPDWRLSRDASLTTSGRKLKVLIVDDNATARALLLGMADQFGWEAQAVESGPAALEEARQGLRAQAPFDVLLMDWVMPGMDGGEAATLIRQLYPPGRHPLIIAITAFGHLAMPEPSDNSTQAFDHVLSKPVTPSIVFNAVVNAGRISAAHQSELGLQHHGVGRLQGLRLLVAEDNRLNQQVVCELLESEGAEVTLANNGQVCLDLLSAGGTPFDLVLMDVQMPVLDGHAAARAIRGGRSHSMLPIVAMTANASASDREASLASGMNDHVAKPFNLPDLVRVILKWVRPLEAQGQSDAGDAKSGAGSSRFSAEARALASAHGIDVEGALSRFGGSLAAYVKALRVFAEDGPSYAQRLGVAEGRLDKDSAAREAHSVKGMAATLGAARLADMASDLELGLRGKGRANLASLKPLADLLMEQAQAMGSLARLMAQPEPMVGKAAESTDLAHLQQGLVRLRSMLQASNLAAVSLAEEMAPAMDRLAPDAAAKLTRAVARLDFDVAGGYCDELLLLVERGA